jgi:hypothetical protein
LKVNLERSKFFRIGNSFERDLGYLRRGKE